MAKIKQATLKYAWYEYTPEALQSGSLSEKEIRDEYRRLRSIANKRIDRLARAGYTDTQAYLRNVGAYKSPSNYTMAELQYKLYQISKFVSAKSSTVVGMRLIEKQMLEKMHEKGLVRITNLQEFGDFMDWARAKYKYSEFDSERVAEVYNESKRRGIDIEEIKKDYELFRDNYREITELPVYRKAERRTSEWYRKVLGAD